VEGNDLKLYGQMSERPVIVEKSITLIDVGLNPNA
jgi:hypothetical protein